MLIKVLCLLLCATCGVQGSISCMGEQNEAVDWFLMYKLPKMRKNDVNYMQPQGGEYGYVDSRTRSRYWTRGAGDVYEKNNPAYATLAPLYRAENHKNILYLLYNDQPPPPFNSTRGGHTKGVLLFDGSTVVWLLHSVPRFATSKSYEFPQSGRENGQLLMCVTFQDKMIDIIARHLLVQRPYVYAKHDPQHWGEKYPNLGRLLQAETYRKKTQDQSATEKLKSKGGAQILSFSKHPNHKYDIYTTNVTVTLNDDLYVETWRNGAGTAMNSKCRGKYKIKDVNTVKIAFSKKEAIEFSYREDHSKWAVAMTKPYFCMSSLNRMESQFDRGGGVLCIKSAALAKLFRNSIKDTVSCSAR